ncbi:MAG: hypothetical protein Q4A92_10160 [Corynebacterium sp.]|nr:hypothetical protein [Corynebacterium sp.]
MNVEFHTGQTIAFPPPTLGVSFPIGGPLTDAALARAAAQWQVDATHLQHSTDDWLFHVRRFFADAMLVDLDTAWRLACQ